MKFLQDPIERNLSRLLRRRVSFARLNASPLAGQIEAEGMTVAGDEPNRPLLSVLRIGAKISVGMAIAGRIVIKSLVIEGPMLNITRQRDGSVDLRRGGEPPAAGGEADEADGWQLEAQSIRVVNGRVSFEDRLGESGYSASAEQINGELKRSAGQMDFNFSVGSIGRRDRATELGPLELTGQISGAESIKDLGGSPIRAELQFAGGFRLSVDCPALAGRQAAVELRGSVDIAKWLAALPPAIALPPALSAWKFNDRVEVQVRLDIDGEHAIHIQKMDLGVQNVLIPLRGISGQSCGQ
ncbi:MAG: hypothetical protein ABSB74_12545 [Tepidisphaeraceae bacterium]